MESSDNSDLMQTVVYKHEIIIIISIVVVVFVVLALFKNVISRQYLRVRS